MILTSNKALEILEGARGKTLSDGWINHSICVGESAYKIAKALNEKGQSLDLDKVKTLGYIHDIGKMVGPFKNHVITNDGTHRRLLLFLSQMQKSDKDTSAELCSIQTTPLSHILLLSTKLFGLTGFYLTECKLSSIIFRFTSFTVHFSEINEFVQIKTCKLR